MDKQTILTDSPKHLIHKYRVAIQKAGIPVDKMILFGSYAKGTAKKWSDVDVCVVSPTFGKDTYDERILLMRLTHGIDDMIEPHPFSPKDLADPWDPLASEIRKYGVVVE